MKVRSEEKIEYQHFKRNANFLCYQTLARPITYLH